jgi:hypothetical protein
MTANGSVGREDEDLFCYLFDFDINISISFFPPKTRPMISPFSSFSRLSLLGRFYTFMLAIITEMMKTIITQPQNGTERR